MKYISNILTILVLFLFTNIIHSTPKDVFLCLPPVTKVIGSASLFGAAAKEGSVAGMASTSAILIPNTLLMTYITKGDAQKIKFWRKFVLFEELAFWGLVLPVITQNVLNDNEDIYPDLFSNSDNTSDIPSPILLLASYGIASFSLLNLIPFDAEGKAPQVEFSYLPAGKIAGTSTTNYQSTLKINWRF